MLFAGDFYQTSQINVVAASICVTSLVCAILCVVMMIGSQNIVNHHDTLEVTFLKFVDDFEAKATTTTLDLLSLVTHTTTFDFKILQLTYDKHTHRVHSLR